MGSHPAPKALPWVGSWPARNMLPWVGSPSPLPIFTIFAHTSHVKGLTAFLLSRGDSSLVLLPPSPSPKPLSTAGRFLLPLTPFLLRFLPYPSRAGRLRRSPGCSDDRRTADSSIKELYTGDGSRRDHRFDRVRLCLAWHSSASVGDDAPTNSDSNR